MCAMLGGANLWPGFLPTTSSTCKSCSAWDVTALNFFIMIIYKIKCAGQCRQSTSKSTKYHTKWTTDKRTTLLRCGFPLVQCIFSSNEALSTISTVSPENVLQQICQKCIPLIQVEMPPSQTYGSSFAAPNTAGLRCSNTSQKSIKRQSIRPILCLLHALHSGNFKKLHERLSTFHYLLTYPDNGHFVPHLHVDAFVSI
jgi:hypothetical protein